MADLPKGITREEKFLYAGATGDTSEMPEAITREENYLKAIAENSGGGGGSTPNDGTLTIQKNGTTVGTFTANQATNETINIVVPTSAGDVSALPDTTKYGASLLLEINSSTFVVTATLKDQNSDALGTAQTIDLPLESVVVSGSYDDQTKKVILTLQSGSTIEFSVADLVSGLQSEITSANKLDADLIDDSTSINKFVTSAEKTAWNNKSDFSGNYNDLSNKPTIPSSAADVNALPASTLYAGASTAGGAATSANKINTDAGSATQPVYFDNGVPVATTYSLAKSVPADAVFTDTTYESKVAASGGTDVSLCTTGEKYIWNNKQSALDATQLAAVNSGIDSTKVAQIATNASDISALQTQMGDVNTALTNINMALGGVI